jgi:glucose-6-phosphate 1-dehydrogenase
MRSPKHQPLSPLVEAASITVLGASGDLARKKIFPALFHLWLLHPRFRAVTVTGFARSQMTPEEFRARLRPHIKPRAAGPPALGPDPVGRFLDSIVYIPGSYDAAGLQPLRDHLLAIGAGDASTHLFYLSLPPAAFLPAARALSSLCIGCTARMRLLLEKPFGHDGPSFEAMWAELSRLYDPAQLFLVDHYVSKEMALNMLALRFANGFMGRLWSRNAVKSIHIEFLEDIDCAGRAAYFDESGTCRDILQNHALNTLALVLMDQPVSLAADDVRDEKVKALRFLDEADPATAVFGQYTAGPADGPGAGICDYTSEPGVPEGSRTETYAAFALRSHAPRWAGVPIVLRAGKALNRRRATVTLRMRPVSSQLFSEEACMAGGRDACGTNDLIISIQPKEEITISIAVKQSGLVDTSLEGYEVPVARETMRLAHGAHSANPADSVDAYEQMLASAFAGDSALFLRDDEIREAWRIVDPLLQAHAAGHVAFEKYRAGSRGPADIAKILGLVKLNE